MPQTPYDPLAGILAKSPIPNAARADAWDAFHNASDENDLASRLRALSLPDSVKADLWDLKAGHDPRTPVSGADFAPASLPYKGQTMPGDTFADKLRNAASVLGGEVVGGLKGAAHSALNIGQMAIDAGIVPGTTSSAFNPAFRNPLLQRAEEATAYSDDPAQRFGGGLETAAELAAPALDVARGGIALAKAAAPIATDVIPAAAQAAAAALGKTGSLAADVATEVLPLGRVGRKVVTGVVDAVKSRMLAKKAAEVAAEKAAAAEAAAPISTTTWGVNPAPVPPSAPAGLASSPLPPGYSMPYVPPKVAPVAPVAIAPPANAGGRIVSAQTPSLNDAMTQAIAEAVDEARVPPPPSKITTPPAPTLPPGYTPRATVPKPKAIKMAAPDAAPAPSAPPKRAYFLKPLDEMQAAGPVRVEPSGSITPDTLPEAWKSRVGQDIFPTTGAEGKEVLDAFRQEMQDRGLSLGETITLVSKNKALPTSVRAQLLRALSKSKAN